PGALFKSFETRQQAEEYILGPDIDKNNKIEIWTDGYCKNNGKPEAIAKLYAVIRTLEIYLVTRMNDLIKERKGKVRIEHVKGHSGVYGNEQADRLAYLGSKKGN
ncbi:5024_t:CDS:2, partial [Scutellospora calospora]